MNSDDRKLRMMAKREDMHLPEGYDNNLRNTLNLLPEAEGEQLRHHTGRWVSVAVATALALFIILPNTSMSVAYAMGNLPIIGPIVQVVTFRTYEYDDGHSSASVDVPEIKDESEAASLINASVDDYTNMLIEKFKEQKEEIGEGYLGLDITYNVVTDSDDWFTLQVAVLEVQASGYEYNVYYNVDKTTGQIIELKDLFKDDSDWASVLNTEILNQMQEKQNPDEGIMYFPDDFTGVTDDQDYYFSSDGELVIPFDEYEIAPGSMGCPEFTIPQALIQDLMA